VVAVCECVKGRERMKVCVCVDYVDDVLLITYQITACKEVLRGSRRLKKKLHCIYSIQKTNFKIMATEKKREKRSN
jgi:hypothetical protein